MGQSIATFVVALVLSLGLSRTFRRSLAWLTSRERKAGKEKIHRLFPKPRRPLGGGLAILLAGTASVVLVSLAWRRPISAEAYWVFAVAWAYALIGLLDDLRKARGRGLRDRSKLLLQLVAAVAFGLLVWRFSGLGAVRVPFSSAPVDFGFLFAPFVALVVLATANAVNLSDGIDGLAGGVSIITLLGLALLVGIDPSGTHARICWPLIGAILGFLVYNLPPARLLMGDTGALGIGAAIAAIAILARAEFLLLLFGAVFVVNAASVLVQMGTVRGLWRVVRPLRHRTTETGRPFLCTPIHHHFQWLGWKEWQVLALFWGLAAVMAAWALLSVHSGVVWLSGIAFLVLFLLAAALQKRFWANYFLGLASRGDQSATLALYRGLPIELLGWPLYRKQQETSVTEGMLIGATAESLLWRPITEIEAHIVLGKIYADHKLLDQAVQEWEEVPTRNMLIRPNVVLRLARIYYGRDRLLEAIKLWEQLPASRLQEMPNLREVVRSAKLRLADLAGKSYRQGLRMMRTTGSSPDAAESLEAHFLAARRFNQDLLSLLLYERDKLRGRAADPQAARARRELLHRTRNTILGRIRELDEALAWLARTTPPAPETQREGEALDRLAQELQWKVDDVVRLIAEAGSGEPTVVRVAVHPKASRNTVYRIDLEWSDQGPASVIAKLYESTRIAFFSACYRRERGVLDLLYSYGCAVPQVYGGELKQDRALLVMQDLGDETLAERLETTDRRIRAQWLSSAVNALAALHATAHSHLPALTAEIRKVDKERLATEYFFRALRIALDRIASLSDRPLTDSDWQGVTEQAQPLVDLLCDRPGEFIHFEFTPHHLLVTDAGLYSFDFEQATIGPVEFDLAALLAQPESDIGPEGWESLIRQYAACASESGLAAAGDAAFERAVAYAALFKCLVYAGAAANFLAKFGGEHHLQRFHYYLDRCETTLRSWAPLRPLGLLLAPHFRAAREVDAESLAVEQSAPSG